MVGWRTGHNGEISMRKPQPFDPSRRSQLLGAGATLAFSAVRPWRALAQATGSAKLSIGVIGSGHIGGTIGGLWIKAGHPVLFSSRHPDELKHLVAGLGSLAQAGTVSQAIAFGDVLLVAVPYHALPQVGQDYVDSLTGKIVLDACNAVAARDGPDIADEAEQNGIGITSQKYLPGTRLVRAFNTLNYKCRLENSEQAYWPAGADGVPNIIAGAPGGIDTPAQWLS